MMAKSPPNFSFKAIIIGGSVAGLTLAHMFERANIDYVVLEARDTVAPARGTTIVIMPNAARILDQLGVYEGMEDILAGMKRTFSRREDGTLVSSNEWPQVVEERLEYTNGVCERRVFLKSMFDQLKNKSKVMTGKRVASIEHGESSVTVLCEDGSRYTGDIVIGADGIRSRTRQEMQRFVEETGPPGLMGKDRHSMTAEYNCIYGTSSLDINLPLGDSHTASSIDHSALLFVTKNRLPQWFFFSKMPRRYIGESNIPRFTTSDMKEHAALHSNFHFTENATLKDLMDTSETVTYLPLEEANFEIWSYGRFVCVGDAVHKMTPNLGQGGNQAIESAAVLTNCLLEILVRNGEEQTGRSVRMKEIESALVKYQNLRQQRAKMVVKLAGNVTRSDALDTLAHTLQFLYKPATKNLMADFSTKLYTSAPCLDFLPQPSRIAGNKFWDEDDVYNTARRSNLQRVTVNRARL